ncbi:MAG: glycosyltransferase [Cyanobacteria bacterium J06627_28]
MAKLSVLTLTRNRTSYLKNLLEGLARSRRQPDECIIVHMNEPANPTTDLSVSSLPFSCQHFTYTDPEVLLPLPQARNLAAAKSSGDILLFLDVDCIPSQEMLSAYEQACLAVPDAILMGQVQYLPENANIDWRNNSTEIQLSKLSKPHPKRDASGYPPLTVEQNYGLFWSLSFALQRSLFHKLGEFSRCYPSYGAEDTDFAWKARAQGVSLRWVPSAIAYHQFHTSSVPPWHNFDSIVYNAQIFYQRWGEWPMESWLTVFQETGHIEWDIAGDSLTVLKTPAHVPS